MTSELFIYPQLEGYYCYLLDENGFVVAGNDGNVSQPDLNPYK